LTILLYFPSELTYSECRAIDSCAVIRTKCSDNGPYFNSMIKFLLSEEKRMKPSRRKLSGIG